MGLTNWQMVIIIIFIFFALVGVLLGLIQVTDPTTGYAVSVWSWLWSQIAHTVFGVL